MHEPCLVSVITPTHDRAAWLPRVVASFQSQTYASLELIVLDDSPQPALHPPLLGDARIKYIHTAQRLSVGAKRNRMVDAARGEIIVHFDDDDYYSPSYVARMVDSLGDADLIKLSGWYAYSVDLRRYFYWRTDRISNVHYIVSPGQELTTVSAPQLLPDFLRSNLLGYGFSYVYRKQVANAVRFIDRSFGEDVDFFARALEHRYRPVYLEDVEGLALHVMHQRNSSRIFPQFLVPEIEAQRLFPSAMVSHLR